MRWVGLTGGIASGKTTVANMFRELGVPVIDADHLAHQALLRNQSKIVNYFGQDVLNERGEINRHQLGLKVFDNQKQLKWLEELIHPYVQEKVAEKKRLLARADEDLAIYDVPLLFENSLQDQFDEVILVYVPESVSKERLMARNGMTLEQAEARLRAQMSIEKKKELADVVFANTGDRDDLRELVDRYLQSTKS
jgi:dephospho-CoA kinase